MPYAEFRAPKETNYSVNSITNVTYINMTLREVMFGITRFDDSEDKYFYIQKCTKNHPMVMFTSGDMRNASSVLIAGNVTPRILFVFLT